MEEEYAILVGKPGKSGDLIISALERIWEHVLEKQGVKKSLIIGPNMAFSAKKTSSTIFLIRWAAVSFARHLVNNGIAYNQPLFTIPTSLMLEAENVIIRINCFNRLWRMNNTEFNILWDSLFPFPQFNEYVMHIPKQCMTHILPQLALSNKLKPRSTRNDHRFNYLV
jgi:hypothetical protein